MKEMIIHYQNYNVIFVRTLKHITFFLYRIKSKASLDLSSSDSESPTSRSTMFSRINMANQKKEKRKGFFGDLRYFLVI